MEIDFKEKDTKNKIVAFLKNNVARVNTIKAEGIANVLANNSLELLLNDSKYLLDIKGISYKSIDKIKKCLKVYVGLKEILQEIKDLDDNEIVIDIIYKGIGVKAVDKIRENPYCICEADIEFVIADKIALSLDLKADDKNRIKQAIMCAINKDIEKNGNLFSHKDILKKNVLEFLNKADTFTFSFCNIDDLFDNVLNSLIIDGKVVVEENCIYREDYYGIEKNIVERIKTSLKMDGIYKDIDSLEKDEALKNYKLNSEQKEAVFTAITNKISIITGGPGTGKTQTINVLLSVIHKLNPNAEIKISAPTGKAAIKVYKTTGHEATTIHKLLNLAVGDPKKNKVNTINADFLILDESSMIDAYLFCELLSNTNPKTNIVIVGDHQQLPSVGPGAILRDLISSGKIPVVILKEVHRQKGGEANLIVKNAHRLLNGDKDEIEFNNKEFVFIEEKDEKIIDKLVDQINLLTSKEKCEIEDFMVLSTVNDGEFGIKEINKNIHNWCYDKAEGEECKIEQYDKVIQTKNNYQLDIMNGEIGIVWEYTADEDSGEIEFEVKYDDKIIKYNNKNMDQLQLAYCISIHKSQGSEFPIVLIPISDKNMYMANVNTLYTGITRAKKKIILIGNKQAFFEAISRRADGKRNSRIVERFNM